MTALTIFENIVRKPIPPALLNAPATREQWFEEAVEGLSAHFEMIGIDLPRVKVSCGWPGGGSIRKRIGECWTRSMSASGLNEIFISPLVAEPVPALAILMHELIHAADDCKSKHGPWFGKQARGLGLLGKLTATYPSPELAQSLAQLAEILGPYPHLAMTLPIKAKQRKASRTFSCDSCEFKFSASFKAIEQAASGLCCPACKEEIY